MIPFTRAALVLVGLLYPFAVFLSLDRVGPGWFALPLSAIWLAHALHSRGKGPGGRVLPTVALAYCAALASSDSSHLLRAYPVMVNAVMLWVFASSLVSGMPVVERLARLRHAALPPAGVRYTRNVTAVWALFFLLNGSVASWLAVWGSWENWTLYNGGISYVLIGLLASAEWLMRPAAAKGRA